MIMSIQESSAAAGGSTVLDGEGVVGAAGVSGMGVVATASATCGGAGSSAGGMAGADGSSSSIESWFVMGGEVGWDTTSVDAWA